MNICSAFKGLQYSVQQNYTRNKCFVTKDLVDSFDYLRLAIKCQLEVNNLNNPNLTEILSF